MSHLESLAAPQGHRSAQPGDYTPDSLADEVNKAGEEDGGGGEMGKMGEKKNNTTCGRRGEQTEGWRRYWVATVCEVSVHVCVR